MPMQVLDHYNVITTDAEKSSKFYVDVLGLRVGDRPPFPFPGAWIYCGDMPVIHLSQRDDAPDGSGRCSHVAFKATDYADMKGRLDKHGVQYVERTVPGEDRGQTQIFVETPDQVTIELIFQPEDVAAAG
jgi:catechol 2,3-dioxygenase-like lactoylglutathione lyase family enzyme